MRIAVLCLCLMVFVPAAASAQEPSPSPSVPDVQKSKEHVGINGESFSLLAGTELAIGQMIGGFTVGAVIGESYNRMLDGYGLSEYFFYGGLAGSAIGLAGSVLVASQGVTPAHAVLLNSGPMHATLFLPIPLLFGALAAGAGLEPVVGLFGSYMMGLGIGHAYYLWEKPLVGQVSLISSAGLWGFGLGLFGASFDSSEPPFLGFGSVALGHGLGLIGGAVSSQYFKPTRLQVLASDVSGLATGVLLYNVVGGLVQEPERPSVLDEDYDQYERERDSRDRLQLGGFLLGSALGWGVSAYLLKDFFGSPTQDSTLSLSISPPTPSFSNADTSDNPWQVSLSGQW